MPPGAVNPFIEYRHHLDVHARALESGLDDRAYIDLVTRLDEEVRAVAGVGFAVTPVVELDLTPVGDLPPVMAKVETGAVGGSHKARHLFGLALRTLIDEANQSSPTAPPDLAIASCGNAAIGAAIVAKAIKRDLQVFVPEDADPVVIDQLDRLGAGVAICPRDPSTTGDPCIHALDATVAGGAQAFTVQGPRCPEVIDGCRTLGLELATQLDEVGIDPASIYIQIGGGALATAVMDGLARAWPSRRLPRLHPVQARAAHPYVAGWRRIVRSLAADEGRALAPEAPDRQLAEQIAPLMAGRSRHELEALLGRQAALMTPWPDPPHSVASGILDDITYDWLTVAAHQSTTGGWPVLVEEATFALAASLAADQVSGRAPAPDETGAAGLAGLIQHHRGPDELGPVAGPAVVLLTGAAR
jgi:cysteine synthase